MNLQITWFVMLCVLWSAYFVTEGFDFGVGMLLPILGRDEADQQAMLSSIGPVWDGNEVWLIIAGAVTFAAFPEWYATMFSGFYVALLLILVLLIIRIVSFEWRSKGQASRWRSAWSWVNTISSFGAPVLWGIGLSSLLYGTPVAANQEFTGSLWSLFSWYSIFTGLAVALLFALHGALYLSVRTDSSDLRVRALALAARLSWPGAAAGAVFLVWTLVVGIDRNHQGVWPGILVIALGAVAVIAAVILARMGRPALAFVATAMTLVLAVVMLFVELYPRVMVSSTDFANSLTVQNASSNHYTLAVMSVVALILLPVVILYQAWTYHVFRARLGGGPPVRSPVELLGNRPGGRGNAGDDLG